MRLIYIAIILTPASALPVSRGLINISPEINPSVDSRPVAQCLGIAVCNPVTVNNGNQSPAPTGQQQQAPPQQTSSGGGGSLINVAPVVSPNIEPYGFLKCLGVANCNPVTVNKGDGAS
ncbi:hypothetical protein CDEST_12541 [Colletotrichum destructivum]|uniref:Hydrophobin n=1 Tax=Colletotrichum destructivum TaxID=34406 RepID=A0AAX4IWS5_9PEZI|nr:hypothetical protein CDEST_12541 [Colletotrichum destructivum]